MTDQPTPPVSSTPVLWSAGEAAAATNGRATTNWATTGVAIDNRTVQPGDLFVALRGPNHDGHDFVAAALRAGAAAAIVTHRPADIDAQAPLLIVEDTFSALQDLGRVGRLRARARIIAVTGSVGKTGTKEGLRHVLAAQNSTYASAGNLNNQWGVPLSLARLPADVGYGVFELGMNHAGEIGPLARQVQPDIAIITTIEAVHLEFFASLEAIADAKAEIFSGMEASGIAILNRDTPHFGRLVAAARTQGLQRIWSFGSHARADAQLIDCEMKPTGSRVKAVVKGHQLQYCLPLPGRHWVLNSLAVLLAAHAAGADLEKAAQTLVDLPPVKGRGTRRRIAGANGVFTVIDESYNASPVAVAAALQVLGGIDPDPVSGSGPAGRRVVVLGDMLELGPQAAALHAGLLEPLTAAAPDLVFACGANMKHLFDRLPASWRGHWTPTSAALAPAVAEAARAGDVILVKGSLGSRMSLIVDALLALDTAGKAGPHAL